MYPRVMSLGPLTVHSYGVMMALGFLAGMLNWVRIGRAEGRDVKFCSDLLLWIMVAGIVGARTAHVLSDWRYYAANPWLTLRVDQGGLAFYGGFIGAWAALVGFARVRRISFFALADFVTASLPLAHAFGRIGCFLNGCCHGRLSAGCGGVHYPHGSAAWYSHWSAGLLERSAARSLPVYPVQLYEAAFNLALFGVLALLYRRRRWDGMVGVAYLLLYGTGRFLLETLRGDERVFRGGLSTPQWVSLGLVAAGLAFGMLLRRRAASRHA